MERLVWAWIAAGFLINGTFASAQGPQITMPFGGMGSRPLHCAETLGAAVRDSEHIAVWHIVDRESERIRFQVVRTLKFDSQPVAVTTESDDAPKLDESHLHWSSQGREAVVFINGGAALVCFGPVWFGMTFYEEKGCWESCYPCESLGIIYSGSTDVLIQHVRAIIAGREVVVAAERPVLSDYYSRRGSTAEAGLWRIKASLKIDTPPLTVHSPHFVGLGAIAREDLPQAITRLGSNSAWVRSLAIREIASLGKDAKDALPALYNRFADPLGSLRIRAAVVAMRIEPSVNLPLLPITLELRNENQSVRADAARVLGELGELAHPVLPFLFACFEREKDPYIRPRPRNRSEKWENSLFPFCRNCSPVLSAIKLPRIKRKYRRSVP